MGGRNHRAWRLRRQGVSSLGILFHILNVYRRNSPTPAGGVLRPMDGQIDGGSCVGRGRAEGARAGGDGGLSAECEARRDGTRRQMAARSRRAAECRGRRARGSTRRHGAAAGRGAAARRGFADCGGGNWPDCQSRRSCSRRPKMRARAAMIRAWMGSGIQAHFSHGACAVKRRQASLSPREEDGSMRRILTNVSPESKEIFAWLRNFFW